MLAELGRCQGCPWAGLDRQFSQKKALTWWARRDLNPGPRDYESPALTAELQALVMKGIELVEKSMSCSGGSIYG